jgi:glycosyltransferase involved in cell wall biosynthesis
MQQIGWVSMCYFGHGKNFQGHREIGLARKIKQLMVRRISIWFAYTEISRQILIDQKVPDEKIVVVNNTLTESRKLHESEVQREPKRFVYIGGLYKEKRLDVVFESVALLHAQDAEIRLVIAGTGPMQAEVKAFADANDWCEYLGPVFGIERDKLLLSCTAILNPGLVGLIAIDSFHYAIPIITVTLPNHSPEIAYLENEKNALILPERGDAKLFAEALNRFLSSQELSDKLRQGCRDSSNQYTLDDTAQRFVTGVMTKL